MNDYDLSSLKGKQKIYFRELEKDLINYYDTNIKCFSVGVALNYITEKEIYEIYCYVSRDHKVISGLKTKITKSKIISVLYFKYLQFCIKTRGLKFFFHK